MNRDFATSGGAQQKGADELRRSVARGSSGLIPRALSFLGILVLTLAVACTSGDPNNTPPPPASSTSASGPSSAAPSAPPAAAPSIGAAPSPGAATASPGLPVPSPSAAAASPVVVQPQAARPGATTVKVQVVGTLPEAAIYIAAERGYFADEGINPEFVTFSSSAQAVPALATGQIDVSSGIFSAALFNAVNRGIDIRVVMPESQEQTCERSSIWIIVRPDLLDSGAVKTPADLAGRKVAGPSATSSNGYVLDYLLQKNGKPFGSADYVEMGFGDMGAALQSHAIDAAVGAEPTATVYENQGFARKWICGADIEQNLQFTYLMYSSQLADQNTDVGKHWMAGYVKGARDYQRMLDTGEGRDEIFQIISKYTPIKDRALFDKMSLVAIPPDATVDQSNLQAQAQWAVQRGFLDRPPDVNKLIDTRFIDYARQNSGT